MAALPSAFGEVTARGQASVRCQTAPGSTSEKGSRSRLWRGLCGGLTGWVRCGCAKAPRDSPGHLVKMAVLSAFVIRAISFPCRAAFYFHWVYGSLLLRNVAL